MKFEGTLFGFGYDVQFKTEEEFIEWFIDKMKKMNPLLPKIMDVLLNESADFNAMKVVPK